MSVCTGTPRGNTRIKWIRKMVGRWRGTLYIHLPGDHRRCAAQLVRNAPERGNSAVHEVFVQKWPWEALCTFPRPNPRRQFPEQPVQALVSMIKYPGMGSSAGSWAGLSCGLGTYLLRECDRLGLLLCSAVVHTF